MLVLSRPCDSEICIGADITIKVLGIHKRKATIGIEAPPECSVWRKELAPFRSQKSPNLLNRSFRSQRP